MKYSKNRIPGIQLSLGLCVIAMLSCPVVSHAALLLGDEIYISFDNSSTDFTDGLDTWNRLAFSSSVGVLDGDLQNTGNVLTGVGISQVDKMTDSNGAGDIGGSLWPDAAAGDYWFGDNGGHSGSSDNGQGEFTFTGLDTGTSYKFDIFGSRGSSSGTRQTIYTVTGANTDNATLNVINNKDDSVIISNITPNGSGEITFHLMSGLTNDSTNEYYYINALKITAIPESSTFVLLLGSMGLLMVLRRRK